jgi:hypothetical protein
MTLRTRSKPVPIGDSTRCTRYTSSTCLICQVLVYRIHQVVPLDVEGKDGPLLPTNEWVEKEILKSATGWIELHKDAQVSAYLQFSCISKSVIPSGMVPCTDFLLPHLSSGRQFSYSLLCVKKFPRTNSYTNCLAE